MFKIFQVASDESDYEVDQDNEVKDKKKLTLQLLKTWQEEIQKDKYVKTIAFVCIYVLYSLSACNFSDR